MSNHIIIVDLTDTLRYRAYATWHLSGVLELVSQTVDLARDAKIIAHGATPKWLGYCNVCAIGTDIQRMEVLPEEVNVWEILDSHGLICECE